jgi:hypothetical protein
MRKEAEYSACRVMNGNKKRRPLSWSPFAVSRTDLESVCVLVGFFVMGLMHVIMRTVVA